MKKGLVIFFAVVFLIFPDGTYADVLNETRTFWVSQEYDVSQRTQLSATLRKISVNAYWYMEDDFWNSLGLVAANYVSALDNLALEFDSRIYPKLRELFGSEWNPGIDNDPKITILLHRMKTSAGGYFTPNDEHPAHQIKDGRSNEREIIYLNANHLQDPSAKVFLAHEFQHLITFNQRTKIRGENSDDDIWLNEIRSEYTSAYLGYDADFRTNVLETRKRDFLAEPSDSLTEWRNEKADYANINLFGQYLADRFGSGIMTKIIQSSKTGTEVLDDALSAYGDSLNFSRVFGEWLVTVFLNNCSLENGKYCYKNPNLQNVKIAPTRIFSLTENASSSVSLKTKDWTGHWYQFNQWFKVLKVKISGSGPNSRLGALYIVNYSSGKTEVKELEIQKTSAGEEAIVYLTNDPLVYNSAVFIVFNQFKTRNFSENEESVTLTLDAEILQEEPRPVPAAPDLVQLQQTLDNLKNQLQILIRQNQNRLAIKITRNLSFGMRNNDVRILQQILSEAPIGGSDIYPEVLITGYFGPATQRAVQRFQCKYGIVCSGSPGTTGWGVVGPRTRTKINKLLESRI